jgi:uncharacterized protein (TIGR02284 family)
MSPNQDNVLATLHSLIETCRDEQTGFEAAAAGVSNAELKALFERYGRQRAAHRTALEAEVKLLGKTLDVNSAVLATLQRGWLNLKQVLTARDDQAIVQECEQSEAVALQNFETANKEEVPTELHLAIETQIAAVEEALERLKALSKVFATTA